MTPARPRLALALASVLALTGPSAGEPDWLVIATPAPGEHLASALVEVNGHAGPRGLSGHDIVIAIDVSDSTTRPSGMDLDGDGAEGRSDAALLERLAREPDVRSGLLQRLAESDFEDSVLAAQLAAAKALIERLDTRRFRVGLVTFSDEARIAAPVGSSPERLRFALDRVGRNFFRDLRGTDLSAAVRIAHQSLMRARKPGLTGREQSLLILSDGAPTLPVHANRAAEQAIAAAQAAAADGIRIYSFALGREDPAALVVYREMALLTGGRSERVEQPADAITKLRRIDLADLEALEIENLTTGSAARAVRVYPDGSFDGFLELAPGANELRVVARASDGRRLEILRGVVRDVNAASGDAEQRRLRELVEELRRRTRELELWAEVERGRRPTALDIEVEPER